MSHLTSQELEVHRQQSDRAERVTVFLVTLLAPPSTNRGSKQKSLPLHKRRSLTQSKGKAEGQPRGLRMPLGRHTHRAPANPEGNLVEARRWSGRWSRMAAGGPAAASHVHVLNFEEVRKGPFGRPRLAAAGVGNARGSYRRWRPGRRPRSTRTTIQESVCLWLLRLPRYVFIRCPDIFSSAAPRRSLSTRLRQ